MGQAAGLAVDADDHIWVIQRPKTLTADEKAATLNPPTSKCCAPAPPVLEFAQDGTLLHSWGGPGQGYDWVDANGEQDGQILKFTKDGKFVLQIGHPGPQTNST